MSTARRRSSSMLHVTFLALGVMLGAAALPSFAARLAYPPSPSHPVADTLHGQVLTDPYRWLEDDSSAAVQQWTVAQNALTRRFVDGFGGRAAVEQRLKALYAIPGFSRPAVEGGTLFYSKRSGDQNQPVVWMRPAQGPGEPREAIDPNGLSADGTVALDWMYPSPDASLIAYGTSASGSEKSTLRLRRTSDRQDLSDRIPNTQFASVAWDRDSRGFHYTRHPERGQVPAGEEVFHSRVYYHRIGEDPSRDALVWGGEGRPIQESRGVGSSSDGEWLFLTTSLDWAKNDVYVRRAGTSEPFAPIAVGLDGQTDIDAYRGTFYLRSNVDAPRQRILSADPATPDPAHWKVLVPEQAGVIDGLEIVGGRLALSVLENAISRLFIHDLDGKRIREVSLPALGEVSSLQGEPGGNSLFFLFTSFAHPTSVYRYDLERDVLEPLEKPAPGIDAQAFEVRQDWVTSKDGTRVPMFLVHKKGQAMDGKRPTILYGYGGFDISQKPAFRPNIVPWLEAGGVFAQVCLRGGGEFGKAWHEAGRLERKQNVFDDFHAAAEWLVRTKVTTRERLAAQGGSNGGLLVGAALTQRPDLYGAVVCQVPLLDMLRYHQFSIARYWVPEYGSSEDPKQFEFLRAYSPYHNVKPGTRYPATLITTAESDSRVSPLHARKMAALLQAQSGGDDPILVRIESKAGHGAGKPTAKRVLEATDILSFLMLRMGVVPPAATAGTRLP